MPQSSSSDVVLRPLDITRRGYLVGGIFTVAVGAFVLIVGSITVPTAPAYAWVLVVAGIALAVYGVVLAVRGRALSVTLTDDAAVVRGILSTTTVPRHSIVKVTGYPALEWKDASGRTRTTRMLALYLGNRTSTSKAVVAHVDAQYDRFKAWLKAR